MRLCPSTRSQTPRPIWAAPRGADTGTCTPHRPPGTGRRRSNTAPTRTRSRGTTAPGAAACSGFQERCCAVECASREREKHRQQNDCKWEHASWAVGEKELRGQPKTASPARTPEKPLCDIPSGCCFFTGPWTVTRSALRMLRRVAAFCRPLRPVLLLVSFPRSRSPVVGVPGLCWMWRGVPFARQRRPIVGPPPLPPQPPFTSKTAVISAPSPAKRMCSRRKPPAAVSLP